MADQIATYNMDMVQAVSHQLQDADSSDDEGSDDVLETLVAGFRCSDFLKLISQNIKDVKREAKSEMARLRQELSQFRAKSAQLAAEHEPPGVPDSGDWENHLSDKRDILRLEKLLSSLRAENQNLRLGSLSSAADAPITAVSTRRGTIPDDVEHLQLGRNGETWKASIAKDEVEQTLTNTTSEFQAWKEKSSRTAVLLTQGISSADLHRSSTRILIEPLKTKQKNVFADVEDMKEKIRLAVSRPTYNVCDFYHETGIFQAIAKHSLFETITLFIISVNAVWIGVDTDMNTSAYLNQAKPIFQVAEHFFCTYFLCEWFIRFMAFKRKMDALRDSWFVFDSALAFLMVAETWIMSIILSMLAANNQVRLKSSDTSIIKLLRMSRLSRMARMAKLLRAMPELTILIKGMMIAFRSVFLTLILLGILIYIFAVAFRQVTDGLEVGDKYFKSVPYSMRTLLLEGTLPDMATFVQDNSDQHFLLGILSLVFILLGTLTVLNMLVGVLVEVVSIVSAVEKESLKVNFVKTKLLQMLQMSGLDSDEDAMISRSEFEKLLVNAEAAKVIQDVGVDPVGLVDFTDVIFHGQAEDQLSFPRLIEVVLQFRGSNNATVRDVVDLRKVTMKELHAIQERMENLMQLQRKTLSTCRMSTKASGTSSAQVGHLPRSPTESDLIVGCEPSLRSNAFVKKAVSSAAYESGLDHRSVYPFEDMRQETRPNPPRASYPSPPYTPPDKLVVVTSSGL